MMEETDACPICGARIEGVVPQHMFETHVTGEPLMFFPITVRSFGGVVMSHDGVGEAMSVDLFCRAVSGEYVVVRLMSDPADLREFIGEMAQLTSEEAYAEFRDEMLRGDEPT